MLPERRLTSLQALRQAAGVLWARERRFFIAAGLALAVLSAAANAFVDHHALRLKAVADAYAQNRGAVDRIADGLARRANGSSASSTPKPLFQSEGPVAWQGFEDHAVELERLRSELGPWGLQTAQTSQAAAFTIVRRQLGVKTALEVRARTPEQTLHLAEALQESLQANEHRRRLAVLERAPDYWEAPWVSVDVQHGAWRAQALAREVPLALRLGICALAGFSILFMLAATLGLDWDLRRAASTLEPWALVPHPLWVLYGAQLLNRAAMAAGLVLAVVLPTLWWTRELPWGATVCLAAAVGYASFGCACLVGMWGLLSTMLFRHRYGRLFGRLLLSPVAVSALVIMRVGLFSGVVLNVADLAEGQLGKGLVIACGVVGTLGAAAACALVPVVEWRIGRRRQGLRKV